MLGRLNEAIVAATVPVGAIVAVAPVDNRGDRLRPQSPRVNGLLVLCIWHIA